LFVESFTNGNARKIEGVSASETSNGKVRTYKFREILTLILWPFSKDYKFIA
jgi:hypothetical protein